jgi:hypothetical protein
MVLAGDFNTHSQHWDPWCTEWRQATYWEEIIDEQRVVIGNDTRPTDYWTRNESKGASNIDLTLDQRLFGKWTMLTGNHGTGSGHEIIEWEENMEGQEEAGGTQVVGWNLAAISEKDKVQAEKLPREQCRGRAHL